MGLSASLVCSEEPYCPPSQSIHPSFDADGPNLSQRTHCPRVNRLLIPGQEYYQVAQRRSSASSALGIPLRASSRGASEQCYLRRRKRGRVFIAPQDKVALARLFTKHSNEVRSITNGHSKVMKIWAFWEKTNCWERVDALWTNVKTCLTSYHRFNELDTFVRICVCLFSVFE